MTVPDESDLPGEGAGQDPPPPGDPGSPLPPLDAGDTSFCLEGEGTNALPGEGSTSEGMDEYHPPVMGRKVGNYVLVTRLGAGRQSVVWRAVRFDPQIQVVALKVFTPDWTLDRMEHLVHIRNRMAKGGRLEDSAILPVIEYGVFEGHVYYVMPLIDGDPLSRVLRKRRDYLASGSSLRTGRLFDLTGPDYFRAIANLLGKVARALGELHVAGLAHCDVKPDNILLDWADRPFLSDFGLARALDAPPPQSRPGPASGTPLYMPHEKLLGWADCDERRCDVYSLGVTLYESATLTRPFEIPKDLPRYSWAPFLASARFPPPRERQPDLPPALEAIILQAMSRNPAQRHPSATELADDLDRFLGRGPVPAAPQ